MQNEPQSVLCGLCNLNILSKCYPIHQRACQKKQNKSIKKQTINQSHIDLIPCSECGEMLAFTLYAQHLEECVGRQLTKCPQCKLLYPTFLFQEHIAVCTTFNEQEQPSNSYSGNIIGEDIQQEDDFQMDALIMSLAQNIPNQDEPLTLEIISLMKRTNNKSTQDCSICYCSVSAKAEIIKIPCHHIYHTKCLTAWLQKNPHCPMCRRYVLH